MFFTIMQNEDDRFKAERLYYKYRKLMYKEAYAVLNDRFLSEDAISESFIRIINNLHKIDENDCPRTRSFLVIICRNVAKDIYKSRIKESTYDYLEDAVSSDNSAPLNNPQDIIISKESIERIAEIISHLDSKYKDVFILRRVYNMSREDIANIFGINVETVKKRLQRAKAMILQEYTRREHNGQI